MAQEFVIKSQDLEDKINQLLPSQGGSQAGVDLSASTMVVPIVDLTESAEGSQLRQDLQSSLSHNSITSFSVVNTTSTLVNTVGYFRCTGSMLTLQTSGGVTGTIQVTDGATTKIIKTIRGLSSGTAGVLVYPFDFIIKLEAGDSLTATSSQVTVYLEGVTRQIADVSGNLVNP